MAVKKTSATIHLLLGPALMLLCIFFLPRGFFPDFSMRAAVGTILWMAWWWVSSCIDYAVTAFLPIAVNALLRMAPMGDIISNYASETILLLLGASILAVSWEETGLDKRIAYTFLELIGPSLTSQIVFWFFLTTALSALLPNAVVCATITPIAVSMLRHVGEGDIKNSRIGSLILMTIAWGTGLGGLASPLGGAMNLVVVDYIQKITGREFMYIDWVIRFLPIMVVLMAANLLYLLAIKPKHVYLNGTKEYFAEMRREIGRMSRNELICLALFVAATVLSFTRNLYSALLPGLKPAYVFIIAAILAFLIRKPSGERLMVWSSVQKKVVWGLMYVFAGGLAAGTLINSSGADAAFGKFIASLRMDNSLVMVLAIVTLTIILSDLTSNTATAAVSIPIVISVAAGMNLDPIPYVLAATIGVNLSYTMPTSIRAVPVGYGLEPKFMFRYGLCLTLIVIPLMTILAWALIEFWPLFSVL